MKQPYKITCVVLSVMLLLAAGPLSAMATTAEPDTEIEAGTQENEEIMDASTEVDEVINNDVSTNIEQNGNTSLTETTELESTTEEAENEETEQTSEITENDSTSESDTTESSEETDSNKPEDKDENGAESSGKGDIIDWEQLLSGTNTKSGLYYYIQKYQYDCKAVYLNQYIEYITLQVTACEKMYELGDTTETVLKSYRAQKAIAEADLQTAYNESAYNNLYLTKNNLDYTDYNMKEIKEIQSIEYYMENYPEKDYMTMARYVTDYNNAVAGIHAKKLEIEALEAESESANLLYEQGEISKIELAEKEVALAQAEYELETYYVSMNLAVYNLTGICD